MATEPKKELTEKDWKIIKAAMKTHVAAQQRGYNTAANDLLKEAWETTLTEAKALAAKL